MSKTDLLKEVLCPFWRESRRHFAVRVCDNLVDGVPFCIVNEFYPDLDYDEQVARLEAGIPDVKICRHFVRTDAWYSSVVKCGCLFGGDVCFHSDDNSFMSCVGCSRFVLC